ncbi:MAG: acylphosphatase [Candidatus Pseudobacter hemicellulosilyticus]|uniref:acylphosphatase n=1 Tax=Candidatus Pseudobacter hemicellulosilyticus TaxID=3121375 RepID=A0AAJ5WWL2_9BACT|nr:MAG: acylphosphatase [Pseudobacter sp.]
MQQTITILVSGRVQGVFYRQSTQKKARELGVTGSVRNLPDGRVQLTASGTDVQLQHLISWCKQGPPRAIVTDVTVQEIPAQNFTQFTIER